MTDIARFSEADRQVSQLGRFMAAEHNSLNYSHVFEKALENKALTVGSFDSQMDVILPLNDPLLLEHGCFGLSWLKRHLLSRGQSSLASFDLSSHSDKVQVFYGGRLNDYLDFGLGVSQYSNVDLRLPQEIGHSFEIRFSPWSDLCLEYGTERAGAGTLARFFYNDEWLNYPTFGEVETSRLNCSWLLGQRLRLSLRHSREDLAPEAALSSLNQGAFSGVGESGELAGEYYLTSQASLRARLGQAANNQDVKFYEAGQKFVYLQMQRLNYYGSLGLALHGRGLELGLSLMRSTLDFSSRGKLFTENLPDIFSDLDNIEKAADLKTSVLADGCSLSLSGPINPTLSFASDFQLLSLSFTGDGNIWDTWFFGLVKELDQNYALPIKSAKVLVAKLSLDYQLDKDVALNYAIKQLVPLAVESSGPVEAPATGDESGVGDGGVVSGGTVQTLALSYSF